MKQNHYFKMVDKTTEFVFKNLNTQLDSSILEFENFACEVIGFLSKEQWKITTETKIKKKNHQYTIQRRSEIPCKIYG